MQAVKGNNSAIQLATLSDNIIVLLVNPTNGKLVKTTLGLFKEELNVSPAYAELEEIFWDGNEFPYVQKALSGDTAIALDAIMTPGKIFSIMFTGNNSYLVTINGIYVQLTNNGDSLVTVVVKQDGSLFCSVDAINSSTNLVPDTPGMIADSSTTLVVNTSYPDDEVLISKENGPWVVMNTLTEYSVYTGRITVTGPVQEGYYRAKIKAATGRNESGIALVPAFS